jgi:hypothetical protein
MFIVERGSQIMEFVNSVLDSIGAIARGRLGEAAEKVEGALARALPLAISFLASLLGLSGITDKIREGIDRVRKPIEKAVNFVVLGAVKGFKKLFGGAIGWAKDKAAKGKAWATGKVEAGKEWAVGKAKGLAQAGLPEDPQERLELGKQAALSAVNRFAGKPVGQALLKPLLKGIKLRYGFQSLDVIPREGRWHVAGKINPEFEEATESLTPEDLDPESEEGKTLLLGEGNFSFALSIAQKTMMGDRLVATDYMVDERKNLTKTRKEEQKQAQIAANIETLQNMGVEVDRQVDATDPSTYPEGEFDIVVFNHPYVPTRDPSGRGRLGGEAANRELLEGFLKTAKGKVRQGGQMIVISSQFRLARWRLDELAEKLGLDQSVMKFEPEDFEGYEHEKTLRPGAAKSVEASEQFAIIFTVKAQKTE